MATPINPLKTLMGIWKIAMEIITDEIANLKSAWKKTSEQQLFHELETEYGFPRATCRSLVQLMHEFIGQNYGNQREDKQIIYHGVVPALLQPCPTFIIEGKDSQTLHRHG